VAGDRSVKENNLVILPAPWPGETVSPMTRGHYHYTDTVSRISFYPEAGQPTDPAVVPLHGASASSFIYRDPMSRLAGGFTS
jgi:hypothetical protein